MVGRRHEIAWLQSDFYREQFHKMLRALIFCIVIIFVLIGANIYFILFQPMQNFYANTQEGKILAMPPAQIG